MKKLLFVVSIVFLLVSCDSDDMDTNENDSANPQYYTVTYHGNGHTSGEPPVDTKQYKKPKYDWDIDDVETATILPPGTMEKEGHRFHHWEMWEYLGDGSIHRNPIEFHVHFTPGVAETAFDEFSVTSDIHFDAIWVYWPNR